MLIEAILAIILGIIAGCFTGLFPGIHINLISAIIVSSLGILLTFVSPNCLVIFIISMSVTHVFLDFIPSIYLGAPEESSSLSVMPGHALLKEGNGHSAVVYSLLGCIYAVLFSICITPLLLLILPLIYPFIQRMMGFILILSCIFLISKEENSKTWAIIIFILAGFLGISVFNLEVEQPLLPLLSGLFGSSSLIYSISQKTKIPYQSLETEKINKTGLILPIITSSTFSPICAFLPGLGSSQAAILSSEFISPSRRQFLFLVGSVSMITSLLSLPAIIAINKSRTGSAAAIKEIMNITSKDLLYLLPICLFVSLVAFFIAIKISKFFSKNIHKIDYSKISLFVLVIITIIILIFSGILGLFIFITSTILGSLAIYSGIRRGHLMGCLLIPSILYYIPF